MYPHSHGPNPIGQRRIGERHLIQVDLTWAPHRVGRWKRSKSFNGRTVDLSMSGLGFESDPCPDVRRGSSVQLTMEGVACNAVVRAIRAGRAKGKNHYGVEFQDPQMIDLVSTLIAERGGPEQLAEPPRPAEAAVEATHQRSFDWW